jgi:hypothetical protein
MDTTTTITAEHVALAEDLRSKGVCYAVGSFIDITGRAKS